MTVLDNTIINFVFSNNFILKKDIPEIVLDYINRQIFMWWFIFGSLIFGFCILFLVSFLYHRYGQELLFVIQVVAGIGIIMGFIYLCVNINDIIDPYTGLEKHAIFKYKKKLEDDINISIRDKLEKRK